jgi:hypothetical protein
MAGLFSPGQRPRLFFLHVPKTAGTSMRRYLENQYQPEEIFPYSRLEETPEHGIDTLGAYRLYLGHFRYNLRQVLPGDTNTMVILREPLERTLSTLRHLARDPAFHPDHALARGLSISQILRTPRLMEPHRDAQTTVLAAKADPDKVIAHLKRQRENNQPADVADIEEEVDLEWAKKNLAQIEFVGTMDCLEHFLPYLATELSLHPPMNFPFLNENIDQATRVTELPEEDINLLRYYNINDSLLYEYAQKLITHRTVERAILRLVEDGMYQIENDSFKIDLAGPIPGSGWHEAEHDGGAVWRWTGAARVFSLEVPLRADRDWHVSLRFETGRPEVLDILSIELNGERAPFELEPRTGHYILHFDVPAAVLARSRGVCRVVFDAGDPPRGTDLGISDARRLSVLVASIQFDAGLSA